MSARVIGSEQVASGDECAMSTVESMMTADAVQAFADYHPLLPAARRDPYPYYRWLRQHAPVKFIPEVNAYAISRHEDVHQVLLNHGLFSSDPLI